MNRVTVPARTYCSLQDLEASRDELTAWRRAIHANPELAQSQAASYGATVEIDYGLGHPVLVNAQRETEFARTVAEELVGLENVADNTEQVTGSEDFAYMLQQRPGCFVRIGNGVGENIPLLHTARYNFNDENLTVGCAYWVRLAERFFDHAGA